VVDLDGRIVGGENGIDGIPGQLPVHLLLPTGTPRPVRLFTRRAHRTVGIPKGAPHDEIQVRDRPRHQRLVHVSVGRAAAAGPRVHDAGSVEEDADVGGGPGPVRVTVPDPAHVPRLEGVFAQFADRQARGGKFDVQLPIETGGDEGEDVLKGRMRKFQDLRIDVVDQKKTRE